MQLPAYTISQCHLEDLHRAAAASAVRAEARRGTADHHRPVSRELVLGPTIFRRMVARLVPAT